MDNSVAVVAVFGTRPEIIKLVPVFEALADTPGVRLITCSTGQQADLLPAFVEAFHVKVDHDLDIMFDGQSLNQLLARLIADIEPVLARHVPAAVLVQGDTTSALAGALAARYRAIPVIHVEAGLRTGEPDNPFPEETNRRLISHIASLHCAATVGNRQSLMDEGIADGAILVTGNPIVDALQKLGQGNGVTAEIDRILNTLDGRKPVLLTMHRRENFGARLTGYFETIRGFVERNDDVELVFPVHPNPEVRNTAREIFEDVPRVNLIQPLAYPEFICLLRQAWLVLSDSGSIQEEVAGLGKPMLILRSVTERPELLETGLARLVRSPGQLATELDEVCKPDSWCTRITPGPNPFGDGRSGPRIAAAIATFLLEHAHVGDGSLP